MLSTSADILNIVLALCVAILTLFLSLSLYYFISSAQKIHRLIKQVEAGVAKADEVVTLVREKIKNSSAYLMVLAEVAKQVVEFAKKKDWGQKAESKMSKKK
jgi:cell shape-determining protein MreC